ncbi:MAG: hypothetical protein M0R05_05125 [Bacilli bacterium]|nr:hypothetical protein [Bacilli bacterium]MDD4077087.1 hypothetical protein [Bacilli bacterium]MDD4389055.1 hypothetical protein [Bacilli bacterium]
MTIAVVDEMQCSDCGKTLITSDKYCAQCGKMIVNKYNLFLSYDNSGYDSAPK